MKILSLSNRAHRKTFTTFIKDTNELASEYDLELRFTEMAGMDGGVCGIVECFSDGDSVARCHLYLVEIVLDAEHEDTRVGFLYDDGGERAIIFTPHSLFALMYI